MVVNLDCVEDVEAIGGSDNGGIDSRAQDEPCIEHGLSGRSNST